MIPNNVGLEENKPLKMQLEHYQADFKSWWKLRGPTEFLDVPMTLRIPNGSTKGRWYKTVKIRPSEYCWGLYMAPCRHDSIQHGIHKGEALWETVPTDYYSYLLHHIRVQADVENGGVEQGQLLLQMAPSFYDLNNLFQFLLEEGRHSWAMVHILLEHFGHDGLVESEALLDRMCGDENNPRLLDAFNFTTDDWLSHFMWLFLADRDGKYQLQAVTQAAFAPLARASRFMLFEEPLHINMGVSGLDRTLYKSAKLTLESGSFDIFEHVAIPLPVIQKYINYWVPRVLDLFGNDESNTANNMYQIGIRTPRDLDVYENSMFVIDRRKNDRVEQVEIEGGKVLNCIMRSQYIEEIGRVIDKWNRSLAELKLDFQFSIPHERFNRNTGPCKRLPYDVEGNIMPEGDSRKVSDWLPTEKDYEMVKAIMVQTLEVEKYASWISPLGYSLRKLVEEKKD
ncbi:hypothetical protein H0A36_27720 [Endozoicomonas sp. SM1973]|uniref:Uncharacterized protein n=1 Tax=Spartinivicinus marinus TaxID=2994442 RepID=A0A853IL58_9GAMM|nr:hypothetical protein [Spartinivicinus marinus]MCX4030116.1 hypothetical protein [Spartinivicinus marinus]NYZ69805.1 hypothetical protein [Spartinivicinus marinus]